MPKTEWLMAAPASATNPKAETELFPFLARLIRGEDLPQAEAAAFFRAMLERDANPAQIAGALTALTAKGETAEELAGMASVMRERAVKIRSRPSNLIDISGTGASAAKTFNVSTAAALVAAGAGLTVAKQTSRAVLSSTGSADALSALGVNVAADPRAAQASLSGAGICFMFAPKFHSYLRYVGDVRRSLGIRTCLNLLGVLSNPAAPARQLTGVWHPALVDLIVKSLALLETERAWVVCGTDGLDEVTLAGETTVAELDRGKVKNFKIAPEDFGLQRAAIKHLRAKSAGESARIIREVLESKRRDEARALVVINAAAAIIVGGLTDRPLQAARLAEQSIDSGSARIKLERLLQATNKK
jgi:anthranilate phosphoribosyltransferase